MAFSAIFMHSYNVVFISVQIMKHFITILTLIWNCLVMDSPDMTLQHIAWWEFIVTRFTSYRLPQYVFIANVFSKPFQTLVWFFTMIAFVEFIIFMPCIMNSRNMTFEIKRPCKCLFTLWACMIFLLFMNCCKMLVQILSRCKIFFTRLTF